MEKKKTKIFICNYCKYQFKRKDHITKHIQNHHELSEEKKQCCISCNLCEAYFKNQKILSRHIKNCHIKKTQKNNDEIEDVIVNLKLLNSQNRLDILAQAIEETKLDFYSIKEKETKDTNEDDIIITLNTKSNTDILAQAIGTTKLEFIPNINIEKSASINENGKIDFKCSLCLYRTTRLSLLKRHIVAHSSAVHYQCAKCSTKFKYYDNLLKHIKHHDRIDKKSNGTEKKDKKSDIVIDINKNKKSINVSLSSMDISNMSVDDAILNEMIKDIPSDLPCNLNDIDYLFEDEFENSTNHSSPKKLSPKIPNNKIKIISNELVSFGTYAHLRSVIHDHPYVLLYSDPNMHGVTIEHILTTSETEINNTDPTDVNMENLLLSSETTEQENDYILNDILGYDTIKTNNIFPTDETVVYDYEVASMDDLQTILQAQPEYCAENFDNVYYSNDSNEITPTTEVPVELSIPDFDSPLLNCIAMIESDNVIGDTLTSSTINNFIEVLQKGKSANNQYCTKKENESFCHQISESEKPPTNEIFKIPAPPKEERSKLHHNDDNVDDFIMTLLSKRTINMLDDTISRDFMCDLCRSTFMTKQNLKDHKITVHGDIEFICDKCGNKYKSKKQLVQHLMGHSEAGRVRCQVCNVLLSRRSLRVHMFKHNDLKPYECPVCGKKFRTNSSQRSHIKNYHIKPPPKKPRASSLIDMIFSIDENESEKSSVSALPILLDCANHLRQQRATPTPRKNITGHVCSICRKAFNTKGNLDRHEGIHKHKQLCECGITFPNKRKLYSHRYKHHYPSGRHKGK